MNVKAQVKIMRSYDYNHFEVALSTDELLDDAGINRLRIRAAKLADHAIEQYKKKKSAESFTVSQSFERQGLEKRVAAIKENFPKSEWTPEQMAVVKNLEDLQFADRFEYDDDNYPANDE